MAQTFPERHLYPPLLILVPTGVALFVFFEALFVGFTVTFQPKEPCHSPSTNQRSDRCYEDRGLHGGSVTRPDDRRPSMIEPATTHAIPATADSSPKIVKARRNVNTSSSPPKPISTPGTERILGLYTLRPGRPIDVQLQIVSGQGSVGEPMSPFIRTRNP